LNRYTSNTRFRAAAIAASVVLVTIIAAGPVLAQPPIPIRYSTRTMAMGNAGLLSSNPIEMGYFNPGALSLTGGFHIYVPMVQASFNQDFIDLANFIGDNEQEFEDFDTVMTPAEQLNFLDKINDEVGSKWVGLDFDPMIGLQLGKLSFSAYSVSRAQVRFEATLGVRFLSRTHTEQLQTIDPLEGTQPIELFSASTEEAEDTVTGFAADVGGTFTLTKAIAVGGLIRGLVSSMEGADWEPEVCAGVRLKPLELLLGIPKVFLRDFTLEADIQDLANVRGESYSEKLQLGAELKIPFFALRAGMNRGKLTYGAGFHLLIFDFAAAKTSLPVLTPLGVEDQDLYSVSVGIGF